MGSLLRVIDLGNLGMNLELLLRLNESERPPVLLGDATAAAQGNDIFDIE